MLATRNFGKILVLVKMALTEADKQFSSSHWSKRAPPQDVLPMHLKFIKEECDMNRKLIPCDLNIKYGDTRREKYDIYGTDLEDDAPIYVHIHGGFWQNLDKDLSCYMVKPLHDNNYKVIVIGYELCPIVTVPQIMAEIEKAIIQIMTYASKLGTKAVYIGGHSAGGQLVAFLYHRVIPTLPSQQRCIIKELFLISGIYDLIPLIPINVNEKLQLDLATARACSPMYMDIHGDGGRSHIVCNILVGEYDPPKFIEQSREYYEMLRDIAKVKAEFRLMKECDHFSIVERMAEENYEITQMILKKEDLNVIEDYIEDGCGGCCKK